MIENLKDTLEQKAEDEIMSSSFKKIAEQVCKSNN